MQYLDTLFLNTLFKNNMFNITAIIVKKLNDIYNVKQTHCVLCGKPLCCRALGQLPHLPYIVNPALLCYKLHYK